MLVTQSSSVLRDKSGHEDECTYQGCKAGCLGIDFSCRFEAPKSLWWCC